MEARGVTGVWGGSLFQAPSEERMSQLERIGRSNIGCRGGVGSGWKNFPNEDTNLVRHFIMEHLCTTPPIHIMFPTSGYEFMQDSLEKGVTLDNTSG